MPSPLGSWRPLALPSASTRSRSASVYHEVVRALVHFRRYSGGMAMHMAGRIRRMWRKNSVGVQGGDMRTIHIGIAMMTLW